MIARSELKVRVALRFSRIIILLVASLSLRAQSTDELLQQNVTVIGRDIHFEDVLEQLTLQTRMRFIYSSSIISLDKPVTVIARQQPLKYVLDELSTQMNISFKKQGDYFVVKKNNVAVTKTSFTLVQPKLANSEDIEEDEFSTNENVQATRLTVFPVTFYSDRDADITKDLLNLGSEPKLKHRPLSLNENYRRTREKKWFASAGLFINDYGAGFEIQSGLPYLHGIVNVSALGEGMYRFGYGLGTSIPVKTGVSGNFSYTFATLNGKGVDTWHNQYRSSTRHHQLRLMANITLSRHFSVRVGPTFNLLRTSYDFDAEPYSTSTTIRYRATPTQPYLSPSQGYTNTVQYAAVAPTDYESANSWVGFELGVAYRINFSLRK